jgi:amino acid transporter
MAKQALKKVGLIVATAMSITIVVGAGLLALPGLSYSLAGRLGYLPWIIVALVMLPLLEIFSFFAKNNPSAGGVVAYVRTSLGDRFGAMSEVIVLGTFTLGIPAIALIGSGYLQQIFPNASLSQTSIGVISLAYLAGLIGLRISGAIQTAIAALIVVGLLGIGAGYLLTAAQPSAALISADVITQDWHGVAAAIPVVLFAFSGWEMTAFLAEDMEDPKRVMPISIWASFVIVTSMYIFIAWIVATYANSDEGWITAPFVYLARGWLGNIGADIVAIIAVFLVLANVIAAFFSASRGIFSAGRDGLLPRLIGTLDKRQQPFVAMTCTYSLFISIVLLMSFTKISVATLLQLAGQNFFVLYLFAALGYTKLHAKQPQKWIGYLGIASVLAMMSLFSIPGLVYCVILAGIGCFMSRSKTNSNSAN